MINASNIKPHTYYLDFIAYLWKYGTIDIDQHRFEYSRRYYGKSAAPIIADSLRQYAASAISFGKHEDEHIGEQYINHNTRILASGWWSGQERAAKSFAWASKEKTLAGQIKDYKEITQKGVEYLYSF